MHTLESSSGGEPESDEQWCHHSDVVKEVDFLEVTRLRGDGFFPAGDGFNVPEEVWDGKEVVLVIVRYSDGGTFGRTTGYWEIIQAFGQEAPAEKMARSIEQGWDQFRKDYPELSHPWMPGEGYFSSLERVEIHSFPIHDRPGLRTDRIRSYRH